MTVGANRRSAAAVLIGINFGRPLALCVLTRSRTGPNDASMAAGVPRQAWTRPTYGTRKSLNVLPTGVPQQFAYQRKRPRSVRDRHARESTPLVKLTYFGSVAMMSVPPM